MTDNSPIALLKVPRPHLKELGEQGVGEMCVVPAVGHPLNFGELKGKVGLTWN